MISYNIALATLSKPREICYIGEQYKTKHYTYAFQTHKGVFNYGKAADNEWMAGTWCNRVYRKAGGIQGWAEKLEDSNASKMSALMEIYLPEVYKNDVIITINDYTQDLVGEDEDEIERFLLDEENNLVQAYRKQFGCMPALNIQETRAHPNYKIMFDRFFEEEEA